MQEAATAFKEIDTAITEIFGDVLSGPAISNQTTAATPDVASSTFDTEEFFTKREAIALLAKVKELNAQGFLNSNNSAEALGQIVRLGEITKLLKAGNILDLAVSYAKVLRASAIGGYYLAFLVDAEQKINACSAAMGTLKNFRNYLSTEAQFSANSLASSSCGADAAEVFLDLASQGFMDPTQAKLLCIKYLGAEFNILGRSRASCAR